MYFLKFELFFFRGRTKDYIKLNERNICINYFSAYGLWPGYISYYIVTLTIKLYFATSSIISNFREINLKKKKLWAISRYYGVGKGN